MLIPLFIRIWSARQQARRVGMGGGRNHSAARVSMHIHASPTHRLTATTLQWEMGEMVKREWGMDKKGRGGKGNRKGVVFLNTLSISLRSVVRTPACRERRRDAQQIFNWSSARCAGWIFQPRTQEKKTIDLRWIRSELVHEPLIVLFYY